MRAGSGLHCCSALQVAEIAVQAFPFRGMLCARETRVGVWCKVGPPGRKMYKDIGRESSKASYEYLAPPIAQLVHSATEIHL